MALFITYILAYNRLVVVIKDTIFVVNNVKNSFDEEYTVIWNFEDAMKNIVYTTRPEGVYQSWHDNPVLDIVSLGNFHTHLYCTYVTCVFLTLRKSL